MNERTGGSKTVVDGKITNVVTPSHHPDGDRSRDAQGRPRDARGRAIQPQIRPAAAPTRRTRASADQGSATE